jgi:drug/metabolite transporter (DMT)-like permease
VPEWVHWPWLLLVGITALTAHFCMTKAMQSAEVSVVVTLDFIRLPLIPMIGVLLYGESVNLSLAIGGVLMLLGNLVNFYKPKNHDKIDT